MKVKVIKEFSLRGENFEEEEILNLITIVKDNGSIGIYVILEKNKNIYDPYFEDIDDANKYIEFDYKEEMNSAEVYITENESNSRVAKVYGEQQKKIEYWKSKCMKLIEMI